jgi:single-strand DNA-binding protein
MRAIITGRLRQRSYETNEGEKRTVYELQVDEAGPSLRNATAKVTRASRPGNGQPADAGEASGSYGDEPPF